MLAFSPERLRLRSPAVTASDRQGSAGLRKVFGHLQAKRFDRAARHRQKCKRETKTAG